MQRDMDEAEALLLNWADWMRRAEPGSIGYPAKASGGFIGSWIKDDDELAEAADGREMERIVAALESLSQPHYRIIHKMHRISYIVWRFQDEQALYDAAKEAFKVKYFGR